MNGTLECIEPLPIREMTFRSKANSVDKVSCVTCAAILSLDIVFVSLLVELRTDHAGVEGRVFLDVKLCLNMLEVFPQL